MLTADDADKKNNRPAQATCRKLDDYNDQLALAALWPSVTEADQARHRRAGHGGRRVPGCGINRIRARSRLYRTRGGRSRLRKIHDRSVWPDFTTPARPPNPCSSSGQRADAQHTCAILPLFRGTERRNNYAIGALKLTHIFFVFYGLIELSSNIAKA